jgi:hypothetical protein
MLICHLGDEQWARWWLQLRDVVSPRRHDHHHQGNAVRARTGLNMLGIGPVAYPCEHGNYYLFSINGGHFCYLSDYEIRKDCVPSSCSEVVRRVSSVSRVTV